MCFCWLKCRVSYLWGSECVCFSMQVSGLGREPWSLRCCLAAEACVCGCLENFKAFLRLPEMMIDVQHTLRWYHLGSALCRCVLCVCLNFGSGSRFVSVLRKARQEPLKWVGVAADQAYFFCCFDLCRKVRVSFSGIEFVVFSSLKPLFIWEAHGLFEMEFVLVFSNITFSH